MPERHFIIDCDTAEDDILSLISLLAKGVKVHALTVVEGNVEFETEVNNALWAINFLRDNGIDIEDLKVYKGSSRPLIKDFKTVEEVHGRSGLGEISPLVKNTSFLGEEDASTAIINLSKKYEMEFLAISPLTNLALAYLRDPSVVQRIKRVYIMGGAVYARGNITPVAEYNFWVDPDAAQIVVNEFKETITLAPWEVAVKNAIDQDTFDRLSTLGTMLSSLYKDMYSFYRQFSSKMQGMRGNPHPDVITTAVALDKDIAVDVRQENVNVENCDCESRGLSIVDYVGPGHVRKKEWNAEVVYDINYYAFTVFLESVLKWF
ncbi:nucleoside hydrolase [Acidianus sp. RZ1]|uniref:nucleoside hydrolase n=1 Tax=Acidianus sp. RZ1 TaxID=1540082 RepID=UPI001490CF79|nr:nucleoside hydrolase [Acidianus sp. RZ1]NON62639.1 nucleoside hydrolase [Acidianus sp. RZ1]